MKKKQVNIRLDPGTIKKMKIIQLHYIIHHEENMSQADVIKLSVDNYFSAVKYEMDKMGITDPMEILDQD